MKSILWYLYNLFEINSLYYKICYKIFTFARFSRGIHVRSRSRRVVRSFPRSASRNRDETRMRESWVRIISGFFSQGNAVPVMPVIMPIQRHRSVQMRINRVLRRDGTPETRWVSRCSRWKMSFQCPLVTENSTFGLYAAYIPGETSGSISLRCSPSSDACLLRVI